MYFQDINNNENLVLKKNGFQLVIMQKKFLISFELKGRVDDLKK